jgi:hypothetical protein
VPSAAMDLTDPARAAHLVEAFVLPGIRALHDAGATSAIDITPFDFATPRPAGAAVAPAGGSPDHPAAIRPRSEPSMPIDAAKGATS